MDKVQEMHTIISQTQRCPIIRKAQGLWVEGVNCLGEGMGKEVKCKDSNREGKFTVDCSGGKSRIFQKPGMGEAPLL